MGLTQRADGAAIAAAAAPLWPDCCKNRLSVTVHLTVSCRRWRLVGIPKALVYLLQLQEQDSPGEGRTGPRREDGSTRRLRVALAIRYILNSW